MSDKRRKHSGRKRASGELKTLNLRKFEKMIRMSGDDGFVATPHADPRYYPKVVPNKPRREEKRVSSVDEQNRRLAKVRDDELRGRNLKPEGAKI